MAVQVHDQNFGIDGHAKSMSQFRNAHRENTAALINHAEGLPVDADRAPYDPSHPDNQWPLMVHSPKGELTVGKTVKGVTDDAVRAKILKANDKALADALALGYRRDPYQKPQVVVLDPAAEKAALMRRNDELQAQVNLQTDLITRMNDRLAALENPAKQ